MADGDAAEPPVDPIDRAHLRDPGDNTFTMSRYPVAEDLTDLARRFWIPVWEVREGAESPQHVLQYPVCLVVVSNTYARFYGVVSGLSTTTLTGRGWAVGVMLRPPATPRADGRSIRCRPAGWPGAGCDRSLPGLAAIGHQAGGSETPWRRSVPG